MTLSNSQLRARKGRIGSSDIAAILGLSPWQTPFETWLQITGRQEFIGGDSVDVGNALESGIADLSVRKLGLIDSPIKCEESTLLGDWAIATPDFELADNDGNLILLEIKNVGARVWLSGHWTEMAVDGYPPYVYAQVQMQMHVTGIRYAAVGALVGGMGPWVYRLRYDDEFCRGMELLGKSWWSRHVLGDVEPRVSHGDSVRRWLAETYPRARAMVMAESSGVADRAAAKLRAIKSEIGILADEKSGLENVIKREIGDAEGIRTPDGIIKWSERKSKNGTVTRYMRTPRSWSR